MESFNLIYKTYSPYIMNLIKYRTHNVEVSQELTNDVFMKVHKHLDNFDPEKSTIRTWVTNIANNTVIDYYRKGKDNMVSIDETNEDGICVSSWELQSSMKVGDVNPLQSMINDETMIEIQKELLSLPKTYKRICNLFFNHNMKLKDIAKRTNTPLNTIKVTILRSRKLLINKLQKI